MTVPRSEKQARGWFPPATFQLRLRSLRSVIFIGKKALKNNDIFLIKTICDDAFFQ
jgi:hypothetical protein